LIAGRRAINVRFGPWSCKNAFAEALTRRGFGEVATRGDFSSLAARFAWKCFLTRI
jgi:hypothetical protein